MGLNGNSDIYNNQLPFMHAEGWSSAEMSEELGVSQSSIRAALHRRGMKSNAKGHINIRRLAYSMHIRDALEFALEIIEGISALNADAVHPVDMIGVHFTPSERRILTTLHDARRVISKDTLMNALYLGKPDQDQSEIKIIDVLICSIRKKLPPEFAKIVTHRGRGYFMHLNPQAEPTKRKDK